MFPSEIWCNSCTNDRCAYNLMMMMTYHKIMGEVDHHIDSEAGIKSLSTIAKYTASVNYNTASVNSCPTKWWPTVLVHSSQYITRYVSYMMYVTQWTIWREQKSLWLSCSYKGHCSDVCTWAWCLQYLIRSRDASHTDADHITEICVTYGAMRVSLHSSLRIYM